MALATTKESNNILVEDEAWSYAMVLSSGVALPMVLKAVIELDVLEIIKQAGPGAQLSPTEIAAKLAIQNPEAPIMLDRMLCLLASYSVLTCSTQTLQDGQVERLYGLTLVCKFLTKDEDGLSLGSCSLLWHDKVAMEPWYHIKEAILEAGAQFYRIYGVSHYAYSGKDPRCNKLFNNAMADMSSIVMKKILGNYKGFEGISTLVDMAGNTGASLSMVISKYPTIKGINFDLPHVINEAPSYPGVTNIAGDMFTSVPKGDAIFVKSIFHNWDDEHCLKLMKNCYTALPNHGKVIACEYILPVIPKTNNATRMAYHFDITMMVGLNAKERTEPEFEALGKAAGFEGFRIACSAYDFKVMEFLKTN